MSLTDTDKTPFITHEMFNDLPAICIENDDTRIMFNVSDDYECHFSVMADGNYISPAKIIARTLFTLCSRVGINTLTIDGRTVDMEYKNDCKNLARYLQSKEYIHDIMLECLYKQLLIETVKNSISDCIDDIVSYKRSRAMYNIHLLEGQFIGKDIESINSLTYSREDKICELYRNIVIDGDELVIFAGKCIRYLEIKYIGSPIMTNRYIFGNQGYYDSFSDTYCRLNRG